jgi:RHS repeat-associated protein
MHRHLLHPAPPMRVYSPFGVVLEGRNYTFGSGYRYGFNGKEKDDEGMGGGGQTYDYGFRIYNPGLAKFLSVDPLSGKYVFYTPYQFAGNKPIVAVDIDGLEDMWVHAWTNPDGTNGSITVFSDEDRWPRFREEMARVLNIPLDKLATTGCVITHQLWNDDGQTFSVQAAFIPTTYVDGRNLWQKCYHPIVNKMNEAQGYLNQFSSAENGYEFDGEEGLIKYSGAIDDIGTKLMYAPVTRPVGTLLKTSSDLIDTGLDFKNKPAKEAVKNMLVRGVGFWLGNILTEKVENNKSGDKAFDDGTSGFIIGTYEEVGDVVEDAVEGTELK